MQSEFFISHKHLKGASIDEVFELTKIDKWFLRNVQQIVQEQSRLEESALVSHGVRVLTELGSGTLTANQIAPAIFENSSELLRAKKLGFSDNQLGYANSLKPAGFRASRI